MTPERQGTRKDWTTRAAASPGAGWEEAFRAMVAEGGGELLDGYVPMSFDLNEWDWPGVPTFDGDAGPAPAAIRDP